MVIPILGQLDQVLPESPELRLLPGVRALVKGDLVLLRTLKQLSEARLDCLDHGRSLGVWRVHSSWLPRLARCSEILTHEDELGWATATPCGTRLREAPYSAVPN